MLRRKFVTLLGGAMMLPAAARAQQAPLIGLLGTANPRAWAAPLAAFHQGLSEAGYAEGRNVTVDYRWADGQYERLPEMANDLVRRNVSLLVGFTTPAALAAKAATATIPIVFTTISDPVQVGLVASFNRPGGNITGASYQNLEVGPKLLELMREVLPAATAMALLINPTNPDAESQASNMQAVARTLGIELHVLRAGNERELDAAFAALRELKAGGLVVGGDPFLNSRHPQVAATALRQALPAVYAGRTFAAAGGLMSYAGSAAEAYKQAGSYAGRILKGARPADLPVQQTTKVELIINMKTARALGLNIPLPLLGRADEVIE
jgi:putative tryptophan/tyrosine transport system substrate-binding protein